MPLLLRGGRTPAWPFFSVGVAVGLGVLATQPACGQSSTSGLRAFSFAEPSMTEWRLPNRLREISGLARLNDSRLFAHTDERGIIYEMDLLNERLIKAWALGDDGVRADFEGIALVDDRFFLVTSDGRLYETSEGDDDDRLLYHTYGTGVGRQCEVEGLAFEPSDRTLLLLCKQARVEALENAVTIFRWAVDDRRLVGPPLTFPLRAFTRVLGGRRFRASGLERHDPTGHYFVLSSDPSAVAEVTLSGTVVAVRALPPYHRQPEGITFGADGRLIIADEGGSDRARVRAYPTTPR